MRLRETCTAHCQSTLPFRVTQESQLCVESLLPTHAGTLRSATARYWLLTCCFFNRQKPWLSQDQPPAEAWIEMLNWKKCYHNRYNKYEKHTQSTVTGLFIQFTLVVMPHLSISSWKLWKMICLCCLRWGDGYGPNFNRTFNPCGFKPNVSITVMGCFKTPRSAAVLKSTGNKKYIYIISRL